MNNIRRFSRQIAGPPVTFGPKIKRVALWSAILCSIASAYNIQYIGKLYLGDIILCLFSTICIIRMFAAKQRDAMLYMAIIAGVIVFCASALDLINGIPVYDLYRGFARNAVFVAGIIAGVQLLRWFGLKMTLMLLILAEIAPTLISVFVTGDEFRALMLYKYYGASRIIGLIVLFLPYIWLQLIAICGGSLLTYFGFDSRASAAVGFGTIVIFVFYGVVTRFRKWSFVMLSTVTAVLIIPVVITLLTTASSLGWVPTRQEASNEQRYAMALTALEGIAEHPLRGQGSWQSARQYVDKSTEATGEYIGVHSYILQFGFEYGVFGSGVALYLGILALQGIWIFSSLYLRKAIPSNVALIGIWLNVSLFSTVLFSPFGGYSRITIGLLCGLMLELKRQFKSPAGREAKTPRSLRSLRSYSLAENA